MKTIMWKDFRILVCHPQKLLITNVVLLGFLIWLVTFEGTGLENFGSPLMLLMPLVMLMNVYQFSFQLVYSEKSNKSWEKMLYLFDPKQVILAKSILITLVSWVISIIFGGLFLSMSLFNGSNSPSLFVYLFSLFLLPLFGFVLCELMVLLMSLIGQLIVIRMIFIPLFIIALTFVLEAGQNSLDIQVFRIVVYGAISIGISYLIFLLTKKISKERLVTSQ